LDIIVESSIGDIRSAIMALQFACVVELPRASSSGNTVNKGKSRGKRRKGEADGGRGGDDVEGMGKGGDARVVLEAVTRRESSLALFHLMGKVLYNKREPPFLSLFHSLLFRRSSSSCR
jgi:cell cycle checkpoint protein